MAAAQEVRRELTRKLGTPSKQASRDLDALFAAWSSNKDLERLTGSLEEKFITPPSQREQRIARGIAILSDPAQRAAAVERHKDTWEKVPLPFMWGRVRARWRARIARFVPFRRREEPT